MKLVILQTLLPINAFPFDCNNESFHFDSDDESIPFDSDDENILFDSDSFTSSDDEWNQFEELRKKNEEPDLTHKLASWAVDEQINHESLNKLLAILREHPCHSSFPTDARTLVKTPRNVKLLSLAGGTYYHFGIEKGIRSLLDQKEKIPTTVELLLNVDGLPISKSTPSQLWPILCSLSYTLSESSVFPIGIFHGNKKPSDAAQYLSHSIDEMKSLITNGIKIKNIAIKIALKGVICDSPARAFVLNVKTHSGYHSCSKCVQQGQYINKRVCFP